MPPDPPRNFLIPPPTPEELLEALLPKAMELLGAMVTLLGDKEGRRLWKELASKPRGKAKGSTRAEQDKTLLKLYDSMASRPGQDIKQLPRQIAELLSSKTNETVGALEKRVRRLLKQRDEQRRAWAAGNLLNPNWPDK